MTEPTYEFIPGQGWLPQSNSGIVVTDDLGDKYIVIDRMPHPHEKWFVVGRPWVLPNGVLNVERLIKRCTEFTVRNFCTWGDRGSDYVNHEEYKLFTIVPVENEQF